MSILQAQGTLRKGIDEDLRTPGTDYLEQESTVDDAEPGVPDVGFDADPTNTGGEEYGISPDDDRDFPVPSSLEMDPQNVVESWRMLALGRRPKDFMARDLLLNSLFRDERPRLFHNLSKKPPSWLEDHVQHLPGSQRAQAIQLDALHYLHRRHLARLKNGDFKNWNLDIDGEHLLQRLGNCWPYGAMMAPPSKVRHRRCCGLAWLCPWCYARRAVGLYQLLREGPKRDRKGKHLVLVSLSTYGEQARRDGWWDYTWADSCNPDAYYLQSPHKVRRMRRNITTMLRRYAGILGIPGGIITHQISPCRTGYPRFRYGVRSKLPTFRHDYAMLGEVTFNTEEEQERFQRLADHQKTCGHIVLKDRELVNCNVLWLDWCTHPADDRQIDALRLFLAGSSMNYPVNNLEFSGPREERDRIHGAFALPPNFMMDDVQWWSYAEATRGLPLYVPFGTWRTAINEAKKARLARRKAAMQLPSPSRKAAWNRGQALKAANTERKQHAQDSLESLVEVARPLFAQLTSEHSGNNGRPAHRARLKQLLADKGYLLSVHKMKKLMSTLREKENN